jgi:hypothetical protein
VNQDVARLQELLARVQRNAALPRFVPPSEAPSLASALAAAEPAFAIAPEPAPLEAAVASFVPQLEPAPTPQFSAPIDSSVDELLLEDPFPSVPPPPPSGEVLQEDPIPLVSVSRHTSSNDEDVSGVMTVSEHGNQGQPEELLEDDIVEMTSGADSLAPAAAVAVADLKFDDEELDGDQPSAIEEPPVSSSRNRIAGTMDEALARAAEQVELQEGREVPLKTPPPESGPQAAMPLPAGIHAPRAPDVDELLEADILPAGGVHAAQPTAEQLGQTIDLDETRGPALELDHPPAFSEPEPLHAELPNEELEVTLPGRRFAGGYQDDLMPPPEARHDLDAHRQRFGDQEGSASPPESLAQYPSRHPDAPNAGFAAVVAPATVTTDSYSESVSMVTVEAPANAAFAPELLARPEISPGPLAKFIRAEVPRPNTFLELLDSSLALGRD